MPDGDAIGSLIGLGLALRQLGKRCTMACADPVPAKFDFLSGFSEIIDRQPDQEQVIVTVDCSDTERVGALFDPTTFSERTVINIDHHVTNTRFGDVNVLRDLPSTAEIVYALIRPMDVQVDPDIASALLTGLITDTRCLRTGNVTTKQLRTAISLMTAGASLTEITELVFNREPIARICLWGQALANVQTRGRIIWTEMDRRMISKCGASPDDGSGLVSFLASAMGVDVAVVFREQDDGRIEASIRAGPGWDVTPVALQFGGGGHPRASGCTVSGKLGNVRERVLAAIETALQEQQSTPV